MSKYHQRLTRLRLQEVVLHSFLISGQPIAVIAARLGWSEDSLGGVLMGQARLSIDNAAAIIFASTGATLTVYAEKPPTDEPGRAPMQGE